MRTSLAMNKIARRLCAKRKGRVSAGGVYFAAMQLLADIETRFRVPVGGGRATNPNWTKPTACPVDVANPQAFAITEERSNTERRELRADAACRLAAREDN
jgi:hypothetical protein